LQFYNITIHLHPSISSKISTLVGEVDEKTTILAALLSIISKEEEISKVLIFEDNIRFGYLVLSDKIELRTTKRIYSKINSNMEIRIIPISHGG
jgi:hypothetical protein